MREPALDPRQEELPDGGELQGIGAGVEGAHGRQETARLAHRAVERAVHTPGERLEIDRRVGQAEPDVLLRHPARVIRHAGVARGAAQVRDLDLEAHRDEPAAGIARDDAERSLERPRRWTVGGPVSDRSGNDEPELFQGSVHLGQRQRRAPAIAAIERERRRRDLPRDRVRLERGRVDTAEVVVGEPGRPEPLPIDRGAAEGGEVRGTPLGEPAAAEPERDRRGKRDTRREAARHGQGLAGPPVPPAREGEERRPDGGAHDRRVHEHRHRERQAEHPHHQELAEREPAEHDHHHGRGARDHRRRPGQPFGDGLRLSQARAARLGHAGHEEHLVVHAETKHRAEHERRDRDEYLIHRCREPEQAHAVPILEDEHERPEAAGDREQVQRDRFERYEHRPEPHGERDERARDDQGGNEWQGVADGIQVVDTKRGQPSDAEARPREPRRSGGVEASQLPRQLVQRRDARLLARHHVEEHTAPVAGDHAPESGVWHHEKLETREGPHAIGARDRPHHPHPRICRKPGLHAAGGRPTAGGLHLAPGWKLEHDAQLLQQSASAGPHQVPERHRGLHVGGQPIPGGLTHNHPARLPREDRHRYSGDEEHPVWASRHPAAPASPRFSAGGRPAPERSSPVHEIPEPREARGQERHRDQHRDGDRQQPANAHGPQLIHRNGEEPGEPDGDGEARQRNRVPGVPHRVDRGVAGAEPGHTRLAEATHREQRVVDAQSQADHRDDVLQHDGEGPPGGE